MSQHGVIRKAYTPQRVSMAPRAQDTSGHARLRQVAQLMTACWLNEVEQERKQPTGEK